MVTVLVVTSISSGRRALSAGYGLSLLGALIFIVGIMGDLVWHTLFGIEVDLVALLSPTHLLLPQRWAHGKRASAFSVEPASERSVYQLDHFAACAPLANFSLSLFTLATQYANPFGIPWPAREFDFSNWLGLGQMLGITAILLQAGLLMGVIMLAVRRWRSERSRPSNGSRSLHLIEPMKSTRVSKAEEEQCQ
jgi:hypothetical protein